MPSMAPNNQRSNYDQVIQDIADYMLETPIDSAEAFRNARYCLMDSLGCGFLALSYPACTKHLGPLAPGTLVPNGARVPGTRLILDAVKAAWDIGCIIRWLDYNDTWLAAEWGHPSDNLGAILAVADYLSQQRRAVGKQPLSMRDVLEAMIKAHEIQGVLSLENSFNRVGLCHVLLVRIASTAVACKLMGGNREQMMAALSHAWADGGALRTYRHAPNTGPRKSWAAGDAASRAVRLADMAMRGESGIPTVLSAKTWGFYDVLFGGKPFRLGRPYASYVMENILFKIAFPAEFHAQTACEAAISLHPKVKDRVDEIKTVRIRTHESAMRIIVKRGPLDNPADRDHCLEYIVAVGLLFGYLSAEHYADSFHRENPQIDALREKMEVSEDPVYSRDYLDPEKRSIANAVQIVFNDGSVSEEIAIEYPLGHKRRRDEGIPLLEQKFRTHLASRFPADRCETIYRLCQDQKTLEAMSVPAFMDSLVI